MRQFFIAIAFFLTYCIAGAQSFNLQSPNSNISIAINCDNGIYYQVNNGDEVVVETSKIGLNTSIGYIGNKAMSDAKAFSAKDDFELQWGTVKSISEKYNGLIIPLEKSFLLEFRAYNSGLAWRFISSEQNEFFVFNEDVQLNFTKESTVYFPEAKGFCNPFEPNYLPYKLAELPNNSLGLTPLMYQSKNGACVLLSEVNLFSYPGMFVRTSDKGVKGVFPAYPKKESEQILGRWRLTNIPQLSKKMVRKTHDYIAKSKGKQTFPWRVLMIADSEQGLVENNLVACLADKPKNDFSWVKPGKVVWDWYHKWNITDVDFKAGINTDTYKYMIDFAVDNQLEYVNIDDGWCKLHNFNKHNKALNLDEVMCYAKQKQIGIFLWCTWQMLEHNMEEQLNYFASLGVAGLKVDFFDRSDQRVVDFINRLAKETAERQLLLNLHGVYKPTGLHISFPNVVNMEGVLGLEYNKFSNKCTPEHNLTLPFIRNVVGPMDYTPGGMKFISQDDFKKSWSNPHVMTTKAQQLAMYVVYHGGVQMLADSPSLYKADSLAINFIKKVPVTWDETVFIDGEIGKGISIARRKGDSWYLASMTVDAKDYMLDLSFLPTGSYTVVGLVDGEHQPEIKPFNKTLSSSDKVNVNLKKAGGAVFIINPVK